MSLGPLDFKQAVTEGPTFAKYWQYKLAEIVRFLKSQVAGPPSAVDGDIAVFDGTSGTTIKDGGKKISDLVLANPPITPATHTKITYDAKGLVDSGAQAQLDSADFANQGTTTTLLHGNAAGNPSFAAVATADIADNAVTYAKMQDVSAASKLLGRGDSGSGDPQELTLGNGLSITGTTISANAGGVRRVFRSPLTSGTGALFVSVGSNAAFNVGSPTKMTARCWFRTVLDQNNNGIATRSDLGNHQGDWALGFFNTASTKPTFRVNNNAASIQSNTALALGKWYFLEASYDSSLGSNNLKLFINGVLDTQGNYSTAITNNAYPIVVGSYFDVSHCINGYIAEFEFCAGVVRNTSNYTPPNIITPDGSTTVYWSMNQDGLTMTDGSGGGFDGTVGSGTAVGTLDTFVRIID